MGSPGLVALEPGDLDFQRNLPQAVDGSSFRLVQRPSKRCWEAARQLCPALVPPVPPVQAVPAVPRPEVVMQLASAKIDEADEVICVEDEEPQVPEASLREALPSLREAAPSLTLGESMHQIVEIDPEDCQQAESIPKEQHLREPAGPPAQVVPLAEAETVMEGFGGLGCAEVDQFGPQARAAFRPPRGREVETPGAPTLQGEPVAMAPAVPSAFQGCDGSLLGPAARHQFKKPRVLATPARAVSSFSPIGEGATTLNAAAPKLPQSSAGSLGSNIVAYYMKKCEEDCAMPRSLVDLCC